MHMATVEDCFLARILLCLLLPFFTWWCSPQVSTGLLGRDLCFNYVYDVPRRFKMCEGDTLLDLAHRNNKNNTKVTSLIIDGINELIGSDCAECGHWRVRHSLTYRLHSNTRTCFEPLVERREICSRTKRRTYFRLKKRSRGEKWRRRGACNSVARYRLTLHIAGY